MMIDCVRCVSVSMSGRGTRKQKESNHILSILRRTLHFLIGSNQIKRYM